MRIQAKELHLLEDSGQLPRLERVPSVDDWFRDHWKSAPTQRTWLDIHRCKHPDADDYPKGSDGQIYTFHTTLRAEHTRKRRYRKEDGR